MEKSTISKRRLLCAFEASISSMNEGGQQTQRLLLTFSPPFQQIDLSKKRTTLPQVSNKRVGCHVSLHYAQKGLKQC